MSVKKLFNPKWWLVGFAVLHTVMFLVPQLFATSSVLEMAWGEGAAPEHAGFYEFRLGALGIAYTPMLFAMAYLTTGTTRAKMAVITALAMGVVVVLDVATSINQAGYLEDMSMAFLLGLPVSVFGGLLASGLLHLKEDGE
ncbi:MAG TPA: hypothetical protein DIU15_05935 [Deltaproteobacteria bacterium]|nr:hypothetical protein [Deltaproteobacteria bacterium]HCP45559.1 hypothetical protein [Deltaproteobacteria bacterium]